MAKRKVEVLTKGETITKLAEIAELTKKDAENFYNALVQVATDTLVDGKGFRIKDVGTIGLTDREARIGHSPQTGQEIEIAASVSTNFKPAKALKDALN